jgi:hypothetical protein
LCRQQKYVILLHIILQQYFLFPIPPVDKLIYRPLLLHGSVSLHFPGEELGLEVYSVGASGGGGGGGCGDNKQNFFWKK